MPELPEVETMVRGIRPYAKDHKIVEVTECPNHCQPILMEPPFRNFKKKVVGKRITNVRRLGKRVVMDLESGSSIVIEPRMTGLVLLAGAPDETHLRIRWDLDSTGTYSAIWFWDRRGLGTVRLLESKRIDELYGPENLGPDALMMTESLWQERCARTKREIKVVLLDQKVVAGIGNLYASEILHRAAIDPTATADSLKFASIARLAEATRSVLLKAIELEGSTLGDGTYRNALSQYGSYQNEHRVYMREGQACVICQEGTITRIVQSQRSTFFCPKCQKSAKKLVDNDSVN